MTKHTDDRYNGRNEPRTFKIINKKNKKKKENNKVKSEPCGTNLIFDQQQNFKGTFKEV